MKCSNCCLFFFLDVVAMAGILGLRAGAEDMTMDPIAVFNGSNGSFPESIMQAADGTMYGVTYAGGVHDKGTVFEIPLNHPLKTVVTFDGGNGANPNAALVQGPDRAIYGITSQGGAFGMGTLFRLTPDGQLHTVVSFDGANGAHPSSKLFVTPDGSIYGSTETGGLHDWGTLFTIDNRGNFKTLLSFDGADGSHPQDFIPGPDGALYGTTGMGGPADRGSIFRLNHDGTLETIHWFQGPDGAYPLTLIPLDGGRFIGITREGGTYDKGLVYIMDPSGTVTTLREFDDAVGSNPAPGMVQWKDGYFYLQRLADNLQMKSSKVQWLGTNFCGTTLHGGVHGKGTVFRVTTQGELQTIISFTGTDGHKIGAGPTSVIAGHDGNLYGTAEHGGPSDDGVIFRVNIQNWYPPEVNPPPPSTPMTVALVTIGHTPVISP